MLAQSESFISPNGQCEGKEKQKHQKHADQRPIQGKIEKQKQQPNANLYQKLQKQLQ
jgi:hypothetical protein